MAGRCQEESAGVETVRWRGIAQQHASLLLLVLVAAEGFLEGGGWWGQRESSHSPPVGWGALVWAMEKRFVVPRIRRGEFSAQPEEQQRMSALLRQAQFPPTMGWVQALRWGAQDLDSPRVRAAEESHPQMAGAWCDPAGGEPAAGSRW